MLLPLQQLRAGCCCSYLPDFLDRSRNKYIFAHKVNDIDDIDGRPVDCQDAMFVNETVDESKGEMELCGFSHFHFGHQARYQEKWHSHSIDCYGGLHQSSQPSR